MEDARAGFQINVGFSRFVRYFVPGWFAAFWIIFYITRYNHQEIASASGLISYFHAKWFEIVPLVLALGGFLGVCLVGLDSIIHSFVSSRTLDFILRHMLSSRLFHRFPFISFMRLRRMRETFDRLPADLVRSNQQCRPRIGDIVDGPYPSRCFFRETVQNHFWYDQIDKDTRLEMKQTLDVGSMFFYVSSISLLFFVLQLFLYAVNVVDISNFSLVVNMLKMLSMDYTNAVPLALFAYVVLNLSTNLVLGLWKVFSGKRISEYEEKLNVPPDGLSKGRRIEFFLIGISLFVIYLSIIYFKVIGNISWFEFLDPVLLGVFFLLFVSTYWAGAFEYCRFFINYDRYFQAKKQQITSYIIGNIPSIRRTHDKICGVLPKDETRDTHTYSSLENSFASCENCKSLSSLTFGCLTCGSQFCQICALNLRICPKCGVPLAGHSRTV